MASKPFPSMHYGLTPCLLLVSLSAFSQLALVTPTERVNPSVYTGRQAEVGSGGGFTGMSITYYLLENGNLFRKGSRDTSFTFVDTQTPAITARVFTALEKTCAIRKTRFNHPGNLYKFVGWRKGKTAYRVTWGGRGKTVPAAYIRFYTAFMGMLPKS